MSLPKGVREMTEVREKKRFSSTPMVSIIIPTFNSQKGILRCLQSIENQTYPNVEVVVVDRHSKDKTLKIAKDHNARVFVLACGRSAARNFGVANARGLFIFFIDSDMELASDVIKKCAIACQKRGADAVVIPEVSVAHGFFSECRKIEKTFHVGNRFFDVPRFFRKEVFINIGGFDETLVLGEDADLYARMESLNYKTEAIDAGIKHFEGDLSLRQIVLKAHCYGRSLPFFARKNPSLIVKKYSPIHLVWIRNFGLLFKHPIHFIGLIFLKLVEYVAYLTGVFAHLLSVRAH